MKLQLWKSHLVSFLHSGLCKILDDIKLWILSNVIFSRCTCGIAIYIVYHLCLFQPQLHIMDVIEEEHIGVEKEEKFKILQNEWHKKQQYSKAKYCGCEFSMKIVQPVEAEKNVEVRYLRSLISNFCPLFSISITQHNIFMTPFISLLFSHRIRVKAW